VDERVEEILGVPPEKVVGLHGAARGHDWITFPAQRNREKGAAELIKKYGSVENALDHADEVPTSDTGKHCSSSANKC